MIVHPAPPAVSHSPLTRDDGHGCLGADRQALSVVVRDVLLRRSADCRNEVTVMLIMAVKTNTDRDLHDQY